MISESVKTEIDSARKFREQREEIVVSKNQFPNRDRDVLLIAYWALMFDYHEGTLSLLQRGSFSAAYALVRPVVEAIVRAHVALKGAAEELKRIQNDEYAVNFKQIGAEIDADSGHDHWMENFLNPVTRSALHSYAHSGLSRPGRRFDGSDIKPYVKDWRSLRGSSLGRARLS